MNPTLVAIVLAIGAGAVVAVSTRDGAAAAIGLAVSLIASALLAEPLPPAGVLGVRVVAALLVATLIRSAMRTGPRQPSPLGWPSEAFLATAGAVAGLGIAVGLAAVAAAGGVPVGPGVGEPGAGGPIDGGSAALTSMAFTTAAGISSSVPEATRDLNRWMAARSSTISEASTIARYSASGMTTMRSPAGVVIICLVTQAVLLFRIGIAGPALELEEIARAALLVVAGATGAALARAAATSRPARVGDDEDSDTEVATAGVGRREVAPR